MIVDYLPTCILGGNIGSSGNTSETKNSLWLRCTRDPWWGFNFLLSGQTSSQAAQANHDVLEKVGSSMLNVWRPCPMNFLRNCVKWGKRPRWPSWPSPEDDRMGAPGWMPDYFPLTFIRQQWTEGDVVAVPGSEGRILWRLWHSAVELRLEILSGKLT